MTTIKSEIPTKRGSVDITFGLQWGDEGKGKDIDIMLSSRNDAGKLNYAAAARFQGGPNAGHTLKVNNQEFVGHHVPSGYFIPETELYIGNGTVNDPVSLMKEISDLKKLGYDVTERLFISNRASLIMPTHQLLDAAEECRKSVGGKKVGTTGKGIGPAYTDAKSRIGPKVGDILSFDFEKKVHELFNHHVKVLGMYVDEYKFEFDFMDLYQVKMQQWFEAATQMRQNLQIVDLSARVKHMLAEGKNILAEGAQGVMLDIDHGDYPNVTSSNTIPAAVCAGLGIPHQYIRDIIGVTKLYTTKVGGCAFPALIPEEDVEELFRQAGGEFGATTGRPRMCGWLDLVALRYAMELTGVTKVFVSKADICPVEVMKVVIAYQKDDITFDTMPLHLCDVTSVVTQDFAGWNISKGIHDPKQIPTELLVFLNYLKNEFTKWNLPGEVVIERIGTGPCREDTVPWGQ